MKLVKLYEHLLTEASAQACVRQFGKELFASELGGRERDTPLETDYLDLIKGFTDNQYGEETKNEFISAVKNLKGCMNTYPEILIPEKTNIYRGLTIPLSYFVSNKQQISQTNWFNYTYQARSSVQSWSTNIDAASRFGNHESLNEEATNIIYLKKIEFDLNTLEGLKQLLVYLIKKDVRIGCILSYSTNKNEFLFKSKYFSTLSNVPAEEEVLRIDNKPVNCKAKFNDHDEQVLTPNSMRLIKIINQAISKL